MENVQNFNSPSRKLVGELDKFEEQEKDRQRSVQAYDIAIEFWTETLSCIK
ncbi:MAG TPA: hypothetical protein VNX68_06800 [Nitrosopumilaceae archaeon]|nr:hypothetical protein [Nitrosopumilaceae archaeon]